MAFDRTDPGGHIFALRARWGEASLARSLTRGLAGLEFVRSQVVRAAELPLQARVTLQPYRIYLLSLAIFAASRIVVVIGVQFGALLVRMPDPTKWEAGPDWYNRLLRWDSGWYAAIVRDGYRYIDNPSVPSSTVFYPLYPLVSYGVHSVLGVSPWMALLIVANIASVVATLLMAKFFKDELGEEAALLSVAIFSFFPSSLFLSAGYTEPLFLVFVLLSLMLLTRERFVLAAIMTGLSLGTRSTGIVMLPVILWEMLERAALPWSRLLPKMVLCALLAASGLLIFMVYLGITFGQPLAFATGQASWHPGSFFDRFISALTFAPLLRLNWTGAGWFPAFLVLAIISFWRLRLSVALYGLGALLLPYFTLGLTNSMNRYVLLSLPAFMVLGILCKGRPWLAGGLIGTFAALLFQMTALFSQWYWVG